MRVLVVTPRPPWPPSDGGRLHLYHLLRELTGKAQVTLALPAGTSTADDLQRRLTLAPIPWPARLPHQPALRPGRLPPAFRFAGRHFGYCATVATWLRQHAAPRQFDVVVLHGAALGQYLPACAVPVVWDPVDDLVLPVLREAGADGGPRWLSGLRRAALYAWYERAVARRAAATIFVSPVDARWARCWVAGARLEVVPNGVDLDYFRPASQPPVPGTVLFLGSLDYPPNVDGITRFAQQVWPAIHARDRGRRLLIVGRRPTAAVRRLASFRGIELAADVPDVRPYLTQAAVVVAPIRKGAGLKNKILEACAMQRPVVASRRAVGGLSAEVGVDVLVADTPQSWARQVNGLLVRPGSAARLAARGCVWVRQAHRWSAAGLRLFEILASVQPTQRRRAPAQVEADVQSAGDSPAPLALARRASKPQQPAPPKAMTANR